MIDSMRSQLQVVPSVVAPAALSLHAIVRAARRRGFGQLASCLPAWLACTAISYACSFWTDDGEVIQLHIIQAYFIWVAICCYRRVRMEPGFAFAATYVSILCVDLIRTAQRAGMPCLGGGDCLDGIGGGGFHDVLLVIPSAAALVVVYSDWRRGSVPLAAVAGSRAVRRARVAMERLDPLFAQYRRNPQAWRPAIKLQIAVAARLLGEMLRPRLSGSFDEFALSAMQNHFAVIHGWPCAET